MQKTPPIVMIVIIVLIRLVCLLFTVCLYIYVNIPDQNFSGAKKVLSQNLQHFVRRRTRK